MQKKKNRKRRCGDYETRKNRGYYCMHRGWQDHPFFGNEPFTKREAWEWMISEATYWHEGRMLYINGFEISLERGQLSHSIRYMAQAWGWAESKVDRYLKKLQNNRMIEAQTETGQSVITICNYHHYQIGGEITETGTGNRSRQPENRDGTNNKKGNNADNKSKNEDKQNRAFDLDEPPF